MPPNPLRNDRIGLLHTHRRYRALLGPVPAAGATGIAGVVAAVRSGPVPAASATSVAGVGAAAAGFASLGVAGAGLAVPGAARQPAGELRDTGPDRHSATPASAAST